MPSAAYEKFLAKMLELKNKQEENAGLSDVLKPNLGSSPLIPQVMIFLQEQINAASPEAAQTDDIKTKKLELLNRIIAWNFLIKNGDELSQLWLGMNEGEKQHAIKLCKEEKNIVGFGMLVHQIDHNKIPEIKAAQKAASAAASASGVKVEYAQIVIPPLSQATAATKAGEEALSAAQKEAEDRAYLSVKHAVLVFNNKDERGAVSAAAKSPAAIAVNNARLEALERKLAYISESRPDLCLQRDIQLTGPNRIDVIGTALMFVVGKDEDLKIKFRKVDGETSLNIALKDGDRKKFFHATEAEVVAVENMAQQFVNVVNQNRDNISHSTAMDSASAPAAGDAVTLKPLSKRAAPPVPTAAAARSPISSNILGGGGYVAASAPEADEVLTPNASLVKGQERHHVKQ